jgi:hypothetical protein
MASERERYGEFGSDNRLRARRAAALPGRGSRFRPGGLGLELNCGRGRATKARQAQAGTSGQAKSTGCDGDGSFHGRIRPFRGAAGLNS